MALTRAPAGHAGSCLPVSMSVPPPGPFDPAAELCYGKTSQNRLSAIKMALTGQSRAAARQHSPSAGTTGSTLTTACRPSMAKTPGQVSAQSPHPVHISLSTLALIAERVPALPSRASRRSLTARRLRLRTAPISSVYLQLNATYAIRHGPAMGYNPTVHGHRRGRIDHAGENTLEVTPLSVRN